MIRDCYSQIASQPDHSWALRDYFERGLERLADKYYQASWSMVTGQCAVAKAQQISVLTSIAALGPRQFYVTGEYFFDIVNNT